MPFVFDEKNVPTTEFTALLLTNGITDSAKIIEIANKVLTGVPDAERATATDAISASAIVAKYYNSWAATQGGAPANVPDTQGAPITGNNAASTADRVDAATTPTAATQSKSLKLASSIVKSATARSAAAHIESLILTAPAPTERFAGKNSVHISPAAGTNAMKKFDEYEKNGLIVPDTAAEGTDLAGNKCSNSAAFEVAKQLAKKAAEAADGTDAPAYINSTARPTVGGYKIVDSDATIFAAKSGYGFHGMLAKNYGTYIKPATGADSNGLGAYLSKREKVGKKVATGLRKLVVKVIGMKAYLQEGKGDVVYVASSEDKDYNVKTALSFKVYKTKKNESGVVVADTSAVRTVRMSGVIKAPIYKASDALTPAMTEAGIKVSTGAGIGATTVPSMNETDQIALMSEALSILATSASAENSDVLKTLGTGANDAKAIRDMIDGVNSGNPSGDTPLA